MNVIRKLFSIRSATPPVNADSKKRRKLAKRRKAPRGSFRIDANGPILEQARERCQ